MVCFNDHQTTRSVKGQRPLISMSHRACSWIILALLTGGLASPSSPLYFLLGSLTELEVSSTACLYSPFVPDLAEKARPPKNDVHHALSMELILSWKNPSTVCPWLPHKQTDYFLWHPGLSSHELIWRSLFGSLWFALEQSIYFLYQSFGSIWPCNSDWLSSLLWLKSILHP